MSVTARRVGANNDVAVVAIDRPHAKNAVDRGTAEALAAAFRELDADASVNVGILYGEHGTFCAGADLKAIATGDPNRVEPDGDGPMGPSRMVLSKPVIAAVAGHAVAGGLELALWCDLRIAEESAKFGVLCRRWGVPLIDGGTIRLPRIIGLGRALDLILTGRIVDSTEALSMGLVNRVVPDGRALEEAIVLAEQIASFPQVCMREDRASTYEQAGMSLEEALGNELRHGLVSLQSGAREGAAIFAAGKGRGGT